MNRIYVMVAAVLGLVILASPATALKWDEDSFFAQDMGLKKVNVAGLQFLKIEQGARAAAMGGAFTAVADDIGAASWNTAGLVHLENVGYAANYAKWLNDTKVYSVAGAWNTRSSRGEVIGLTVMSHKPELSPETTIYQPNGTGETVTVSAIRVGGLYSVKFTDKFSFGARVSYYQETLYTQKTKGVVLDVGSYFYTGYKSLRVAMGFKNFGADKKTGAYFYQTPTSYNMGAAMEVYGEKGDPSYLTCSVESVFPIDYQQRWQFGAEFWVQNTLALRAGYKWNYDLEQFAVGAGVKQSVGGKDILLDVSYSILKDMDGAKMFDSPLRVSVGGTF